MADNKRAIIQTLLYSSLFNFPLTREEIYYYLFAKKSISQLEVDKILISLKKIVIKNGFFYTLKGNERGFSLRNERFSSSHDKQRQAKQIAQILGYIPTIFFIGISGSVAVGNATQDDDIDLFVVTRQNSLYITRFFILVILQLLGKRRLRDELTPRNKICLNMLVDEKGMKLPKDSHDLYTARELVQLYPIFERDGYYLKLLEENQWTHSFLPNAIGHSWEFISKRTSFLQYLLCGEFFFRFWQQLLIRRHLTREVAQKHLLAFHPNDTKNRVLHDFIQNELYYSKYYK